MPQGLNTKRLQAAVVLMVRDRFNPNTLLTPKVIEDAGLTGQISYHPARRLSFFD